MLTQYRFTLAAGTGARPRSEWAYRLYAALLELSPAGFGAAVHRDAVTPVSQFLTVTPEGGMDWTVNLLGDRGEAALSGVLDGLTELNLQRGVRVRVLDRSRSSVADVDALFALAEGCGGRHTLEFQTPAAFKSRGRYVNLPTVRLLLQSLIGKWNGCVPDCPIEDEDGEGLDALADGLRCRSFALGDRLYYLKGNSIPGFVGDLTLENRLDGFHRLLADALLLFSGYAGVGIKTTLGMGGVIRR